MQQIAAAPGLRYATAGDLNALLDECRGRVLGVVGFGKPSPHRKDVTSAWVDMPAIGAERAYEVWTSAAPVHNESSGNRGCVRSRNRAFAKHSVRNLRSSICRRISAGANCCWKSKWSVQPGHDPRDGLDA
jgi:hypothetical protein